ncbi:acyl-CoA dehydrogenase [Pseudomonadales bacterium]|nr:acyl-CoA dehydrogenase [Pseudomonadales bacterium]
MTDKILNPRDIDFLIYEFLNTELLLNRRHYAGHSKDLFDATLKSTQLVAHKYFANHYRKSDVHEPVFDGKHVQHIRETKEAWDAVFELGIVNANQRFEEGGMQLPAIVCMAASLYLNAANIATSSYHLLTIATASLIRSFASEEQKKIFLPSLMNGNFSGTIALAEAGQWALPAEIEVTATLQASGVYRLNSEKALVTNGDHCLADNIIHMVLARIQGAPKGADGVSLFIVPKILVNKDGSLGELNEIALDGLLPKMGCRNSVSTVLTFGVNKGAEAYLVGKPHRGLHYVSQIINDSCLRVSSGAAALASQGYLYSLSYARDCSFNQFSKESDSLLHSKKIIEFPDVRRMLLQQKSYSEGALALCLYATSLKEDEKTADTECERQRAAVLLDLLAPIVKSWPSKYGCITNDLAIQIQGEAAYMREAIVEQFYRDQRINPIHEGTEGLHALNLLFKKIPLQNQYGFDIFKQEIRITLQRIHLTAALESLFVPVNDALERLDGVTAQLLHHIEKEPERGLANASLYLDMFGRVTMAWIWLRQGLAACRALDDTKQALIQSEKDFYQGKIQAARFYIEWELPKTIQQASLLIDNNQLCFGMQDQFF